MLVVVALVVGCCVGSVVTARIMWANYTDRLYVAQGKVLKGRTQERFRRSAYYLGFYDAHLLNGTLRNSQLCGVGRDNKPLEAQGAALEELIVDGQIEALDVIRAGALVGTVSDFSVRLVKDVYPIYQEARYADEPPY